ncbi:MAG: DUF6901 family protein [Elusimicrobiota bacterium]
MPTLPIQYRFHFADGQQESFDVNLDADTLSYQPDASAASPEWARLDNHKCQNCPLKTEESPYCPVARNLAPVIDRFVDHISFEEVDVVVSVPAREYRKRTSLQKGIGAIFGLIMATSGCPHLDKLRPMAFSHLPFAELAETRYRAIAMYLTAQYVRARKGLPPDWDLKGLERVYEDIGQLNRDFVDRLRTVAMQDANFNAIVGLDCFCLSSDAVVSRSLDKLEMIFSSYL